MKRSRSAHGSCLVGLLSLALLTMAARVQATPTECVVLLHGLARTSASMQPLADAIQAQGWTVANIDYPSRHHPIEALAPMAMNRALEQCRRRSAQPARRIHFVTHSLGGILVRHYLRENALEKLGRVVMIAPPNQGSEVVDALRDVPGYYWLNGPAGMQLGTDATSVPRRLGRVDFALGVIAGTRSVNLILSSWLPNPDDGKVSVAGTMVDGMRDFVTIPASHPFIMRHPRAIAHSIHFLKTGAFIRADNNPDPVDDP